MDSKARRRVQFVLGVLLSATGLVLALRGVNWLAFGELVRQVRLGWLLAAIVIEMCTLWLNAIRWRWLFWPHAQPGVGRLFGILNAAQLANTVLPGHLGLPLRVLLVGQGGQVSRATALTTLAVEKALEGVTLFIVGIVLCLVLDLPDWLRLSAALSGCLLLGLLLIVGSGLRWRERFLGWMSGWASCEAPPPSGGGLSRARIRFFHFTQSLFDGLDSLRSLPVVWRLWILSWLYWAAVAAVTGSVMHSVGLEVTLPVILVLLFVLQIGLRLPSSPGSVGVFEYLGIVSLSIFGIDKTSALGAMLLLHLVFSLPPSLVGVGYLIWTSTGIGQLRGAALMLEEQ